MVISHTTLDYLSVRATHLASFSLPLWTVLLLSMLDTQRTSEANVSRGGTHVHLVVTTRYLPAVRGDVPVRQRPRRGVRIQHYAHLPRLAGPHLNLRPSHQPFGRLTRIYRQAEVDLRDLGTRPRTSIRNREAHSYGPGAIGRLGFHAKLGIREARVGKPVAEWEKRLDAELVVASVANAQTLAIVSDELYPGVLLW